MESRYVFKKHIFIIIPFIIVLLAGLVILKNVLRPEAPMIRPPARVGVFEAAYRPVRNSFEIIGKLEADKSVDLVARVSGFLEEKNFQAGDRVREGAVLFQIDPKAYRAAFEAAQGNLMSAQAQLTQAALNFQRISDLYRKKTTPKSDVDNAQAALDVARAAVVTAQGNLVQAELNLEWAQVKAPFAGEISDSPFSEGSFVSPSSGALATLVASDPIQARFGLSDRLLAELRFGEAASSLPRGDLLEVEARVKINGEFVYQEPGKISYVSPLVDKSTDTVQLKAVFPNAAGKLVPGEIVTVVISDSKDRDVILVPKNSVLYTAAAGSFVYVLGQRKDSEGKPLEGHAAEQRVVQRGVEFPEGIEITAGLKPGEKVIDLGLMNSGALIQPGTPVELIEDPALNREASSLDGSSAAPGQGRTGSPADERGGEAD
ncbi:MAG: efflux RND transporter periplasmic adaptor subunit [Deltaproteobacteria bacterium]|nr:efflux RND transporter periplasmic adaptor subunit [Deltaproteobacteria bacterium]